MRTFPLPGLQEEEEKMPGKDSRQGLIFKIPENAQQFIIIFKGYTERKPKPFVVNGCTVD